MPILRKIGQVKVKNGLFQNRLTIKTGVLAQTVKKIQYDLPNNCAGERNTDPG